jgi:hypothetical protein
MATSIWTRARQRVGIHVTRSAVADLIALARDVGATLADLAGLFGSGEKTPSGGITAAARVAPAPAASRPGLTSHNDLQTLRLERRVRRQDCSRLVRRLPANGVRCHSARKLASPARGEGSAKAATRKFLA